jgi:hypothetical protein
MATTRLRMHDISAINYFLTPEEAQKFIQDICSHSDPNVNCMDASILLIKRSNSKYGPLINTTGINQHYPLILMHQTDMQVVARLRQHKL